MQKRKTRHRFENEGDVRFLTFTCYHNLALFENDRIKQAFIDQLVQVRDKSCFELIAWVIMPNHVHLLIQPKLPDHPVSEILYQLKGGFANTVLRRWRELDAPILSRLRDSRGKLHFWQVGGGYDRNIISDGEFFEKMNYIHNNPLTAQLVDKTTDWAWSSARWYAGDREGSLIDIDGFCP